MSTQLPKPEEIRTFLTDFLLQLNLTGTAMKKQIGAERRTTDRQVRVRAQSSNLASVSILPSAATITLIGIDPLRVLSESALSLADLLKDLANQSLSYVNNTLSTRMARDAATWSIGGLPGFSQAAPDYRDFDRVSTAISDKVLAATAGDASLLFTGEDGPVVATVNGLCEVISLEINRPLPLKWLTPLTASDPEVIELAHHLEESTLAAINTALNRATRRDLEVVAGLLSVLSARPSLLTLALSANQSLVIGNGTQIRSTDGTDFAAVASASADATNIGSAVLVGDVVSVGSVQLGADTRVGNVRTGGSLVVGAGANVTGELHENALAAPAFVELAPDFSAAPSPGVTVVAGETRLLDSGYYTSISVQSGGALQLKSGLYQCNSFSLVAGATISVVGAESEPPTELYVKQALTWQGEMLDEPFPRFLLAWASVTTVQVGGRFLGTLLAPQGKLVIQRATDGATHVGAFQADEIEVEANCLIRHLPFEQSYDRLPGLLAPPSLLSRATHHGFEEVGGWSSAQANLRLVTTPHTQGSYALEVADITVPAEIYGSFVSLADIGAAAGQPALTKLLVDLWVSPTQPNPSKVGALQLFATLPRGRVVGAYVGQASLNALPRGAWSTLTFTLPPTTKNAINLGLNAQIKMILNVTSGSGPYYLDNLRFE